MPSMMKQMLSFLMISCSFFLSGCNPYLGRYVFSLSNVEFNSDTVNTGGQIPLNADDLKRDLYENEDFIISWKVLHDRFAFAIVNKTNSSMKIIWDEAAFIDEEGLTHRVMHDGVKFADRNQSQPPTVIARGSSLEDEVIPTKNASWVSIGNYSDWVITSLFPVPFTRSYEEMETVMRPNLGKSVKVLLPIQTQEITREYMFTFHLTGFYQASGNGWAGYDD